MNKKIFLFLGVSFVSLSSCVNAQPSEPVEKDLISLYSETSRLYFDTLKEENNPILKTYRHKKYGEIPFVALDEYCDTFKYTEIKEEKNYTIRDNLFIVSDKEKGSFIFDANKDTITSSSDISYFFKSTRISNNNIPLDIYTSSREASFTKFLKDSDKTTYISKGKERVYDLKKYNFDIVYQDNKYYAPFTVLSYIFYGFINTTHMYNGKNFFDCDYLVESYPTIPYCYSSKGDFLLDRSGGKLGVVLYKQVEPNENEAYRFKNVIEASGQTTIISCLKDGTGDLKTYDKDNKYIDEGVYVKLNWKTNEDKSELDLSYFSVLEETDTEPISDIFNIRINLDETNFMKKTRSQEIAEATYQELRFMMYELYGKTQNTAVRDFDNFIKDKDYKEDLLSLDAVKYDEAMSKFLLQGIDDCHTSIEYPSLFNEPTFAKANGYLVKYEGTRRTDLTNNNIKNTNQRSDAKVKAGLEIVNETAFIAFDKFSTNFELKGINEYSDEDPNQYAEDVMNLFLASFNKIKKNENIKNVVIDLTCNSGGKTASMAFLISFLTRDPTISVNLQLDESIVEYHYQADLDQDGVFASENDSFQGKYNFYVLTSNTTFSCGNLFATTCKNNNLAKIIGQRSAGGSCIISYLTNSSGYLYHSSSEYINVLKTKDNEYVNNDFGVEVDIELDSSYFYNRTYIDELLKQNH